MAAAKEAVELQLKEETKRREVAEENVELLRSQVEAARRGVMQLQKQEQDRRRVSAMPPGAAGIAALVAAHENSEATLQPSKRTSTLRTTPDPSTGSGLRELRLGHSTSPAASSTSPGGGGTSFFEDLASSKTRRHSGSSVVNPNANGEIDIVAAGAAAAEEATALRNELITVHAKLTESEEARQASESCLKALREFIATGHGGTTSSSDTEDQLRGIRLPPLPTDREPDEEDTRQKPTGWGFKLWKGQPSSSMAESATPPTHTSPTSSMKSPPPTSANELPSETTTSTPIANLVSSWTKTIPSQSSIPPSSSRKISSFFTRSTTPSSNTPTSISKAEKELPTPPEQLEPSPDIQSEMTEMDKAEAEISERNKLAAAREFEHHEDEHVEQRFTPGTLNSALEDEVATPLTSPKIGHMVGFDLKGDETETGLGLIKGESESEA